LDFALGTTRNRVYTGHIRLFGALSSREPGRTWLTVLGLIEQVRSARRRLRKMRDADFLTKGFRCQKPLTAARGGVNE
jgi:hypothetical protein